MTATPHSTTPQTITDERRIAPRRKPAMGTICRLETEVGASEVALVWNLSTSGLSMLMNAPRPTGTALAGFLELVAGDEMLRFRAAVVHVKKLETGDYYVGARFETPLQPNDLKPFVVED